MGLCLVLGVWRSMVSLILTGPKLEDRRPNSKGPIPIQHTTGLFCFSVTYSYNPIALCRLIYNLPNPGQLTSMFKLNGKGVNSWLSV